MKTVHFSTAACKCSTMRASRRRLQRLHALSLAYPRHQTVPSLTTDWMIDSVVTNCYTRGCPYAASDPVIKYSLATSVLAIAIIAAIEPATGVGIAAVLAVIILIVG